MRKCKKFLLNEKKNILKTFLKLAEISFIPNFNLSSVLLGFFRTASKRLFYVFYNFSPTVTTDGDK